MEDKYSFGDFLRDNGTGLLIIGSVLAYSIVSSVLDLYKSKINAQIEVARIEKGLEEKVIDINNNDIPDKVYFFDGKILPYEVDGKNVLEYFKK